MDHSSNSSQRPVIVTDAACDLPPAVVAQYGIHVAPLRILFGHEEYLSGVNMTPDEFYARLAKGDVHPTTSQPTVPEFKALYERVGANRRPILSLHLSEGLSGTVNIARQAAAELPDYDITVYDTGTLTTAEGLQVMVAARALEAGYSIRQLLPLLEQTYMAGDMLFTVDDLSYLHRGGRIGSVRYQIGQLLNIKPIITVAKTGEKKGTYIQAGRARSFPKTVDVFVDHIVKSVGEGNKLRAISMYGDDPTLAKELNARLSSLFDCVYLDMVPTAPVLGVHVGPKALGVSFAAGDWPV